MKQYKLLKPQLNMKINDIFLESTDGTYKNSDNTVSLNASVVENSKEYFERIGDLTLWRPSVANQSFWSITPDLGVIELGWDESRFSLLWQVGNTFENEHDAKEVALAIKTILPTYQKKFSDRIAKEPKKEPKILAQAVQQPTPPVVTNNVPVNIPPPPVPPPPPGISANDPRLSQISPFNKFVPASFFG